MMCVLKALWGILHPVQLSVEALSKNYTTILTRGNSRCEDQEITINGKRFMIP